MGQLRGQTWTFFDGQGPSTSKFAKKSTNDRTILKKFTYFIHHLIFKSTKSQNSTSKIVAAARSNVDPSYISLDGQDSTSKFAKKSTNDRKILKKFTKFTHYLILKCAKFQNCTSKIVAAARSNVDPS